jgi:hypothetical protein
MLLSRKKGEWRCELSWTMEIFSNGFQNKVALAELFSTKSGLAQLKISGTNKCIRVWLGQQRTEDTSRDSRAEMVLKLEIPLPIQNGTKA